MSDDYYKVIYAATATIHLYSKNVIVNPGMTIGQFMETYANLCRRVSDEILSIFQYELSANQLEKAVYLYMSGVLNPQDVEDTEVYQR